MTPNTVLVIENESATVTIVERSLQNEGYTLYSAVDANTGLKKAREIIPSLILLNLAVEGANGLEICKTIHSEDTLKDVPLILLTLREGKFDPIYTKLYGIVNFLKKPFTPDQLLENVREFSPFQAGAGTPAPRPTATPATQEEEEDDSFSFLSKSGGATEAPSYGKIEESLEQESTYGEIDETLESATAFGDADESMEAMSDNEMDDDVFTLDEDVSLEDAQAELESGESMAGGFSAEHFQQNMQMVPEDDGLLMEEDDFQSIDTDTFQSPRQDNQQKAEDDDFSFLENSEPLDTDSVLDELRESVPDTIEDSFDFSEDEPPSPPMDAAVESEIPDGSGLSLDGMGFDMPGESDGSMDFDIPEEEQPAPNKHARTSTPQKKGKSKKTINPRKRTTSSVNRPKSRRSFVILVLLFVVALAAGASYYFFLYEPGMPSQKAKIPSENPVAQQPASVPTPPVSEPAPPFEQGDVPPPASIKPAPTQGEVPPPAVPKPAPKPSQVSTPKTTVPKPPPPRPPAPAQTAGTIPSGAKYAVQFGVFSTEKNAQELVDRLKTKGIAAYIKPSKTSAGTFLYFVLLEGGFKTKDEARSKANEIKSSKGFDATIHTL